MPALNTNGMFARNAIKNVAKADANAVAVKIAPVSMPDAPRIIGLTAKMYAIVMNVVTPAMISVLTSVPRAFNSKNFSIETSSRTRILLPAKFYTKTFGKSKTVFAAEFAPPNYAQNVISA